jgi:hypothetical protein
LDYRARNLELNGPTADSPPAEFDDYVADTELLIVHYCPVSEDLLRRAKRLKRDLEKVLHELGIYAGTRGQNDWNGLGY